MNTLSSERVRQDRRSPVYRAVVLLGVVVWLTIFARMKCDEARSPITLGNKAVEIGNPEAAAALYAQAVRQDAKGVSGNALDALFRMQDIAALRAETGLLDIPDGNSIDKVHRQRIWDSVRARLGPAAAGLDYWPRGTQAVRREQQEQVYQRIREATQTYSWNEGRFVLKAPTSQANEGKGPATRGQ